MSNLIVINTVSAITTVDVKLNTDMKELKAGDKVVVTLKLDNLKEVKKGVNAYKATLDYDKSIFEEVIQSDFTCLNSWEELKYNPENGEFIAIKRAGTKNDEEVAKITLKVKNNVAATKTVVKVKNIETSEGKGDILLKESSASLNVIKEKKKIALPVF